MCPNCLSVHFSFIAVLFPITCEECANGISTSCACFLLFFHWPFLSPRTTCRSHIEHMSHPFPVAFNPICDSLRKKDKARATSNLNLHVPRWARNPPHTRIFEFTEAPFKDFTPSGYWESNSCWKMVSSIPWRSLIFKFHIIRQNRIRNVLVYSTNK